MEIRIYNKACCIGHHIIKRWPVARFARYPPAGFRLPLKCILHPGTQKEFEEFMAVQTGPMDQTIMNHINEMFFPTIFESDYDVLLIALLPEVFWNHLRNNNGHYIYIPDNGRWKGVQIPLSYRPCPQDSVEEVGADLNAVIAKIPPHVKIIAPLYEPIEPNPVIKLARYESIVMSKEQVERMKELNALIIKNPRIISVRPQDYGSSPDESVLHYSSSVYAELISEIERSTNLARFYKSLPDAKHREFLGNLSRLNNPSRAAAANHKILCKEYLTQFGIPLAKTYKTISTSKEIEELDWDSLPASFVMKGAYSNLGNTVVIVKDRSGNDFVLENGEIMPRDKLTAFARDVFSGTYISKAIDDKYRGSKDPLLFEEKLDSCMEMLPYVKCGMADIRLGYYKLVPFHARLRLSSIATQGRSNVSRAKIYGPHINIDGITTAAGLYPETVIGCDTNTEVIGIKVPFWEESLILGSYVEHLFGLNHTTLDIALTDRGPVLMEMHSGTVAIGWSATIDTRYQVKRILEIERNIKHIKNVPTAIALAKEIYTVDNNIDFNEFSREYASLTGIRFDE